MFNEIGSNFFKEEKMRKENINQLDKEKIIYTDSGRNAIRLVLNNVNLKDKIALLPYYTCHTVIEPFVTRGYKIYYYDIDENFNVDSKKFENIVKKIEPNIILVHAYFGKDTIKNIREYLCELKEQGVLIIEDVTQLLLENNLDTKTGDFIIGSIRKWCSIPEGGFIKNNTKIDLAIDVYKENKKFVQAKIKASNIKKEYSKTMEKNLKEKYMTIYKEAEDILENNFEKIFIMSNNTKELLEKYDFEYIKEKRKENYNYLYEKLKNFKNIKNTLGELEKEETPLYFPIFIENEIRKNLQKYLANKNIYCPIIWPKPEKYLKKLQGYNGDNIYNKIICIPCDQRYDSGDMKRVVHNIKQFYKEGEQ